eukprot:m.421482 g.421482  ORF g.421482 m.421482 type:complete len:119 (-) comp34213_c0_seq1:1089-1445(-)
MKVAAHIKHYLHESESPDACYGDTGDRKNGDNQPTDCQWTQSVSKKVWLVVVSLLQVSEISLCNPLFVVSPATSSSTPVRDRCSLRLDAPFLRRPHLSYHLARRNDAHDSHQRDRGRR